MRLISLVSVVMAVTMLPDVPLSRAQEPGRESARIAIYDATGLPVAGQPSSVEMLRQICQDGGYLVESLSTSQLADRGTLSRAHFDLLIIPSGRTFPAMARDSLLAFLHEGGHLLTTGGHAFENLVREVKGQWLTEREVMDAKREAAMSGDRSLVPGGDFEDATDMPLGGESIDARWRRAGDNAILSTDAPWQGKHCASVTLQAADAQASGGFYAKVPVTPGHTYLATGYVRTRDLSGPGIAYLSVYQLNEQGGMLEFRDFAAVRQSADWTRYEYQFAPGRGVTHVRLQAGLYRKNGTASFDDVQLWDLEDARFLPINTSWGEPGDGLKVLPQQLGIFDPSYPLKRATQLRTSSQQKIASAEVHLNQPLQGFATSGVVGSDQARWVPLLETADRYGRPRGPAGAVLLNYAGHYAGSCWAYFGLENVDLFADPQAPPADLLRQTIRFLVRGTFLHNLQTATWLYREGDPLGISVQVANRGRRDQQVGITLRVVGAPDQQATVLQSQIPAGTSQQLTAELPSPALASPVCHVEALLTCDGEVIDVMRTAAVVQREAAMAEGPVLRFRENYFTLNGRPLFLFGTDTYARTYTSAAEHPGTWEEELIAARDMGMNLYENLQYQRPKHQMSEEDWQKFLAMTQLTQQQQLVFMPGMLIGHNTAVGPDLLQEQSSLCREYAQRMHHVPGLLYYINGDYQQNPGEHAAEVARLWRQWLEEHYGSLERLHEAWGKSEAPRSWDELDFPPSFTGLWDDRSAIDMVRFKMDLTRRWNESHVAAVRSADRDHPITSEYYSLPSDGIDVRLTIDGQDVSNIGYFDEPIVDIQRLPTRISFADLRLQGKGVSLGEYGVKTHPAWTVSNGATHYHIRRTELQQRQLFMAVAHYGLGLGCSKIQNWCLRDAQTWIFPWGIFYPNQLVPKDVAYTHRNLSVLWRFLTPRYERPTLVIGLASQLRLGNDGDIGAQVAYRTAADLLAVQLPFGSIDDDHFEQLDDSVRLVIYPSPFAVSDASFQHLLDWVERGGTLLVTGDVSYDPDRKRTRSERLTQLAGVQGGTPRYPHIGRDRSEDLPVRWLLEGLPEIAVRPCQELQVQDAEVLGSTHDGLPVLVRRRLGRGMVYYCSDPLELAADARSAELRRALYRTVAAQADLHPTLAGDQPWLHVMRQPTRTGTAWVVYNTKTDEGVESIALPTAAGTVRLTTRNGWPGAVVATGEGAIVLVQSYEQAGTDQGSIWRGAGHHGVLSLDGRDLQQSRALLITPFEPGEVVLPARDGDYAAVVGELAGGSWQTLEVVPLSGDQWKLEIDADRATALILVCPREQRAQWEAEFSRRFARPDTWPGY